jgi:hypothetical protein
MTTRLAARCWPSSVPTFDAPASTALPGGLHPNDLLVPVHLRRDDVELRLFSTFMTLGSPHDVTLQESELRGFRIYPITDTGPSTVAAAFMA